MERRTAVLVILFAVAAAIPAQVGGSHPASAAHVLDGIPAESNVAAVTVDYSNSLGAFDPRVFGTIAAPYYDPRGFAMTKLAGFQMIGVAMSGRIPRDPDDPSQYDFTKLDQQVLTAVATGVEPLVGFPLNEKPRNLSQYATYVQNVARHLTQGWGNGYYLDVKLFGIANEPDNPAFWKGTQQEFFESFAAGAKALKAVDPDFVIDGPGLMDPRDRSGTLSSWVTGFLDYAELNDVPVDLFSVHAYSPIAYSKFSENFRLVRSELEKHPTLSPLYGVPGLANNEWNTMVGDLWSGSYHESFDTAWVAAHNVNALINMVEQGLRLSVRYGGAFNGGQGGCHDFPLTDCNGLGKPAYYAFEGFNRLAGTTRLSTSGTDGMNFAAIAGRDGDRIVIVIANYDTRSYLEKYEPSTSPAWAEFNAHVAQFGEPPTYASFNLTLQNLPWSPTSAVVYERYLVDDTHNLSLVDAQVLPGAGNTLSFHVEAAAPSVQVIEVRPVPPGTPLSGT
ncbi:MAG: hypothetical protein HY775_11970 [Acidobacteria bacterium]|nr:hypothetical protein [Acidobacteriota bacterium]